MVVGSWKRRCGGIGGGGSFVSRLVVGGGAKMRVLTGGREYGKSSVCGRGVEKGVGVVVVRG